jgi:hypothetical protein
MAAPISLRGDFDGPMLRALVLAEKAGSVTRRMLSLVTDFLQLRRHPRSLLFCMGMSTSYGRVPHAVWALIAAAPKHILNASENADAREGPESRGASPPLTVAALKASVGSISSS